MARLLLLLGLTIQAYGQDLKFESQQVPTLSQPPPAPPVRQQGPPLANYCIADRVACINKYTAVMPDGFDRTQNGRAGSYLNSAKDPGLAAAADYDFLVFDELRGAEILGRTPQYQFMFSLPFVIHEAPVYVPELNRLYFSPLGPASNLDQYYVDLNSPNPQPIRLRSRPAVYQPNGGTYYKGNIIWATAGGGITLPDGSRPRPGLYAVNATTGVATTLLNNYFGNYFNSLDDLVIDAKGDIWFTDPTYGAANNIVGDAKQQLRIATYRFRPSTGAVYIVEDSLEMPNGIVLSPDGRTMYISDTPATRPRVAFDPLKKKTIYAYDVSADGNSLLNKRPIFENPTGAPDGLKVARNGYIIAASGNGVDVIDPVGTLLVRIQTPFSVQNIAFTGPSLTDLWIVGFGAAAKVRWALPGLQIV